METDHTFVILAYKESKHLEECVKSVYRQSVPSKVLMVTSTPNAYISHIAAKYQLEVMVNTNGGSIGKDWNFGFAAAKTTYVTLAHQDDVYFTRFTELCLKAIKQNAGSKPVLIFNRSVIEKDGRVLGFSFKNLIRWLLVFPFHFKNCISSKTVKKSVLMFSNSISCPGVMYGKGNHLPPLVFDEGAKYILDWKAWYDMSQMDGAFIYVPRQLHLHREHSESATSTTQKETLQHEEMTLLTRLWGNRIIPKIITAMLGLVK